MVVPSDKNDLHNARDLSNLFGDKIYRRQMTIGEFPPAYIFCKLSCKKKNVGGARGTLSVMKKRSATFVCNYSIYRFICVCYKVDLHACLFIWRRLRRRCGVRVECPYKHIKAAALFCPFSFWAAAFVGGVVVFGVGSGLPRCSGGGGFVGDGLATACISSLFDCQVQSLTFSLIWTRVPERGGGGGRLKAAFAARSPYEHRCSCVYLFVVCASLL